MKCNVSAIYFSDSASNANVNGYRWRRIVQPGKRQVRDKWFADDREKRFKGKFRSTSIMAAIIESNRREKGDG